MIKAAETLGFIGLGNMGAPIAQALLEAGAALCVCDVDAGKVARFEALGAVSCSSPRDVAEQVETVITCLPSVAISAAVRQGQHGLAGGSRLRNVIEMSTVGTVDVRRQAEHLEASGVRTLDAPVSGGSTAVLAGTLLIMVGGDPAHFAGLRGILEMISPRILHVGPNVGDGQAMKIVNNLLAASNMAASFEALLLGVKLGLRPSAMIEAIGQGSGANTGFSKPKIEAISSRRFDYGPRLSIMQKDIEIAFGQAEDAGFPTSRLRTLQGMASFWSDAVQEGLGDQDITMLISLLENETGVTVEECDV